ncbi:solute carrier family 35 member F1-like [Chlorella sorokiniana]|uniref:Solute carrier family 35 member F1-like n=1 Tax=Chlorella sorokiniana TaxID=3076 RepID=A0A2P6U2W2_CHLSO|nr:solute carrier family 35 member F1-like [Chlorella sorokiniana]|eukprot:PRW60646.1 solute carrier family 35 member F1-like [Chlorella sorokiniana]
MDDEASVAYIAASAQSMLMASYNFTATFDSPGAIKAIDAGEMGSLTLLPGPPGLSISWALLEIGPCSMILPHTHPSGNEVEWTLAGEGLKAGLMPNGATKMETKDIPPGTLSVYPQGLNHLQFNTGCDQAKLFVTFDQPYPTGLITVPANVVGMPAWMAAASLNAYGGNVTVAQMEALQAELLALLIAGTAVCSTLLAREGVSAPTLQSSLNYFLLGVVYTAVHIRSNGFRWKCRWWAYAVLALLDVEANACLVLAYRFTSLTSVTLLDSFTIPMALVLSAALLGASYRRGHYAGAAVCVAGLLLLVATDRSGSSAGGSGSGDGSSVTSNPLLGDGLVVLGATLYALCNVLQEWLLGDVPAEELLGMLGCFGCLWSAAQGLPLELPTLLRATWSPAVLLPFLGFGLAMFTFYSLVPLELRWGGAALLNVSLLASDLWTALARYLFLGGFPGHSLLFFAASLGVVACGIALFTLSGDVEAQLGAGSARAAAATAGGLPVAYHRVPGGGSGQGGLGKDPQEALEEMQRQHRYLQEVPPAALPNPFAIGQEGPLSGSSSSRADGSSGPAFMPLPAADNSWPAPSRTGGLGSGGTSPLSIEVPPAAAAAAAAAAAGTAPTSPALAGEGTPRLLQHASFDVYR